MKLTIVDEPPGSRSFAVVADDGETLKPAHANGFSYYGRFGWNLHDNVLFLCPFVSSIQYLDSVLEDCSAFLPGVDFSADANEITMGHL